MCLSLCTLAAATATLLEFATTPIGQSTLNSLSHIDLEGCSW